MIPWWIGTPTSTPLTAYVCTVLTACRTEDETRKYLELNVGLTLFVSRINEMKSKLEEHKKSFQSTLRSFSEALTALAQFITSCTLTQQHCTELQVAIHRNNSLISASFVEERQVSLVNQVARYSQQSQQKEMLESAQAAHSALLMEQQEAVRAVEECVADCLLWQEHHEQLLEVVKVCMGCR
jgi:hypothetical protein